MGIYNSKDNTLRRHRVRYQHKVSNLIPINNKNNKLILLYISSVLGTRLSVSHLILKTIQKGGIVTQPLLLLVDNSETLRVRDFPKVT